jgi:hypothetical protein
MTQKCSPATTVLGKQLRLAGASKKEALELSHQVQAAVKSIEKTWWQLARLVDTCLKRRVPAALGLNAKQWMDRYLEASLSTAFRRLRIFRELSGVSEEKIMAMPELNATQLCRLPERERKSEEWVEQATSLPAAEFREKVDSALEERGIVREKFGDWHLKAPVDVIEDCKRPRPRSPNSSHWTSR